MTEALIGSSVLILLILVIRKVLYKKLSKRLIYGLWLIVVLRLTVLTFVEIPYGLSVVEYPLHSLSVSVNRMLEDNEMASYAVEDNSILITDELPVVDEKGISLKLVLLLAWWIGIILVLFVHFIPLAKMWRNLKRNRSLWTDKDKEHLRVYIHPEIPMPFLFGQDIYCPEKDVKNSIKLQEIIRHETMHYQHLDPVWNMFRCLITAIYWFHPLVWLAVFLSKQDAEYACDEAVTRGMCEEEKEQYCKVLLEIATGYSFVKKNMYIETGMASGNLKKRIKHIMEKNSYKKAGAFVIVLFLLLCTLSTLPIEAANYYNAEQLALHNEEYKISTNVVIKEIIYDKETMECIFENVSEEYYFIEEIQLISYDSVSDCWRKVQKKKTVPTETAFVIQPENTDGKFSIPMAVKKKNYVQVVVGKVKTEPLEEIYGNLSQGTYILYFVISAGDDNKELVYKSFQV